METFSRMVKKDLIEADHVADRDGATLREVEVHVRQHLSSICNIDDDPGMYYPEVTIDLQVRDNGDVLVVGTIGRNRVAPYLEEGWTPEADVDGNPLSVPSIDVHGLADDGSVFEIVQPEGESA